MVTEDDLINTVAAAYSAGWRQVKLYFMCGLPTETDEDVLQIAELAKRVIETGRRISGKRDIRCTVSIGGFVPKPHTPFQWVGQLGAEETDARLAKLREAIKSDKRYGSAIGFRYHDGQPGIVEGLLSRGDRRVGQVIEAVWRDGGRFDGWSEHFSYERWMRCAAEVFDGRTRSTSPGTPPASASSPRCCPGTTSTRGWTRSGSGRTGRTPSPRPRSTTAAGRPCFDCGVCPQMGTEIEVGPTGKTLLPLTVVNAGRDQLLESR